MPQRPNEGYSSTLPHAGCIHHIGSISPIRIIPSTIPSVIVARLFPYPFFRILLWSSKFRSSFVSERHAPTAGEVLEFPRSRAEVAFFWDGVEDTPRPVTTRERSSVPAPVDLDPLLLQGEEYHKGANGDGTRERGRGDAKGERAVIKTTSGDGEGGGERGHTSYILTTSQGIASECRN